MNTPRRKVIENSYTSTAPGTPGDASQPRETGEGDRTESLQNEPLILQKAHFIDGEADMVGTSSLTVDARVIDANKTVKDWEKESPRGLVRPDLTRQSWRVVVAITAIFLALCSGFIVVHYDNVSRAAIEIFDKTMALVCTADNFDPLELEDCIERAGGRLLDQYKDLFTVIVAAFLFVTLTGLIAFFIKLGSRKREDNKDNDPQD